MTIVKRLNAMSMKQRGSALLVTLMVIVGLSMLGLGFVAMSETESAISINHRNYARAQVVSEAAARFVTDWFNQPERMAALNLMPATSTRNALMQVRWIDTDGDGTAEDKGRWKGTATYFCCDKPYRPAVPDRLYGTYWSPDVLVNESTTEGRNFLVSLNAQLFPIVLAGTPPAVLPGSYSAEVTEIRIYAPPIIGATNTPNDINGAVGAGQGFYDEDPAGGSKGTRYGLATIAVTAQVRRLPGALLSATGNRVLSERTTRIVVSEWPFPGPQGPIQSNANIQTGGSTVVHWGKMTAQGSIDVKREFQGLPWLDAHQIIPWWYAGNDTSVEWSPNQSVSLYDVVRPTDPTLAADHAYQAIAGGMTDPATEPAWPTSGNITDNTVTWVRRNPARFEVVGVSGSAEYPVEKWGDEIMLRAFEDPWIQVRARGAIDNIAPNTAPEPFKWNYAVNNSIASPSPKKSHWAQFQDHTETAPSSYNEVIFPRIDYTFWKELAIAGQGTEGVFYFRWVSDDLFSRNGVVNSFKNWTNTDLGAKAGFYFFDTQNAQNPQVPGGEVFLTPEIQLPAAGGGEYTAMGFIYVNTERFGTRGIKGVDGWFNFPGEMYLDRGVPEVDTGTGLLTGDVVPDTEGNRLWDFQDVNGNNRFDLFIAPQNSERLDGVTSVTAWKPVYWYEGCTILDNSHDDTVVCAGVDCCSEPHEPYLNLQFPTRTESGVLIGDSCCTGGQFPNSIAVGWFPNNAVDKLPKKKLTTTDTIPDCTGTDFDLWDPRKSGPEFCTSNYFDRNGPFDWWEGSAANAAPILNGVMYVEGTMRSTGNGRYFGSLLINGSVDNTGDNEVWFDERLIKDEWPPPEWPFPRVFISAIRTDDL